MYHVLLVDDEPIICFGLQKLIHWDDLGLELAGIAHAGEAALAILRSQPVDIMLVDVAMPRMSGLELLHLVRGEGMCVKAVVISAHSQFDYVREALQYGVENYLLKPVNRDELTDTLLAISHKLDQEREAHRLQVLGVDTLRENVLYRYATGAIDVAELADRFTLLNIPLVCSFTSMAIIHAYAADGAPLTDESLGLLKSNLQFETAECRAYSCLSPENLLFVLYRSEQPLPAAAIAEMISQSVSDMQLAWFAAVSEPSAHAASLTACYHECQQLLTYEFLLPRNQAIYAAAITRNAGPALPQLNSTALKDKLLENDKPGFELELSQLFSQLQQASLTPRESKSEIAELFIRLFGDMRLPTQMPDSRHITLLDILEQPTLAAMQARIASIAEHYVFARGARIRAAHPVVAAIRHYVEENYAAEISLKQLGEHMHFSPAYLGQVFKAETGRLFSEYLCTYRIDKAKALLRETALRAGEIGVRVGIASPNYFSNTFKKLVGMYPSSYRALHQPTYPKDSPPQ